MRGFIRESESEPPVSTLSRGEKQKKGPCEAPAISRLVSSCSGHSLIVRIAFTKSLTFCMFVGVAVMFHSCQFFFLKLKLWRHTCRSFLVRCFKHWLSHTHKFQPLRSFAAICACLTYRVGPPCLFERVAVMFHVSCLPEADTFMTHLEICGFSETWKTNIPRKGLFQECRSTLCPIQFWSRYFID